MSLSATLGNRRSMGMCLACNHEKNPEKVIEIMLGNVSVRVCPYCAYDLMLRLEREIMFAKKQGAVI